MCIFKIRGRVFCLEITNVLADMLSGQGRNGSLPVTGRHEALFVGEY